MLRSNGYSQPGLADNHDQRQRLQEQRQQQNGPGPRSVWLQNLKGSWRDARCPCGSNFHFEGKVDDLFSWERIHLRHMASDYDNHEMLSFYPKDMVIIYHSASGYVLERRRHRKEEMAEVHQAQIYGNAKLAGV